MLCSSFYMSCHSRPALLLIHIFVYLAMYTGIEGLLKLKYAGPPNRIFRLKLGV